MKTKIYKSYTEFLNRENKKENGVSEYFVKNNPDYENMNEENEGCHDCSGCSGCSGCYGCSGCSGCYGCSGCSGCYGCSGCSGCYDCYDCSDCSDCFRCSDCSDCSDKEGLEPKKVAKKENILLNPPKIKNIHTSILEATSKLDALDMSTWHTCETTHCRAGWVVHLAGEKGKELESKTSTLFAAMMIYKASSLIRVSPTRFFDKDIEAMNDIKKCAELESKQ